MAERPVFIPNCSGPRLVDEVMVDFKWHPGMSVSQKMKNVDALHAAAQRRGLGPLLEVSSKSAAETGKKLSAFSLKVPYRDRMIPLECAFQGSKVFDEGGPYTDLYDVDARTAKRDPRLRGSGRLKAFFFDGERFPLQPETAFYDWLYFRALLPYADFIKRVGEACNAFTDIEFNPQKSIACQARSLAMVIALIRRDLIADASVSFADFCRFQSPQYAH